MNILIIGNGGREHAIAWKIAQSKAVKKVFVAPGNGGTASETKCRNIAIDPMAIAELIQFATDNHIDLTIVGPEAPLVAGIVDQFHAAGLRCFGPNRQAAQLEGSKTFSKTFMQRHQIPSARFQTFTDPDSAKQYIQQQTPPIVIKADGLAAGKGVIIAHDTDEAARAIDKLCTGQNHPRLVIEEFLSGEEASFIALISGKQVLPLATSQDHKARDDGDKGPNTGGMGAYSPAPIVSDDIYHKIMQEVIQPTVSGLHQEGIEYIGFLYAGLMISTDGSVNVLEYNCRLGDPEAQVLLMRLQTDLVELCNAAIDHNLTAQKLQWDPRPALGVVLAAGGYPEQYQKGDSIQGLDIPLNDDQKIFHAGTRLNNNTVITHGGRVLCVTSLGKDIAAAQQGAYALASQIQWPGVYYRNDIGHRALKNLFETSNA